MPVITPPTYTEPTWRIDGDELSLHKHSIVYTHMDTDSLGNIYLAGYTWVPLLPAGRSIVVSKFDLHGNLIWNRVVDQYNYEPTLTTPVTSVYFSPITSFTISGDAAYLLMPVIDPLLADTENSDWSFIKFDSMGNTVWEKRQSKANGGYDIPYDAIQDANGNFYLSGVNYSTGSLQFVTASYDANGTLVWTATNETLTGKEKLYTQHVKSEFRNDKLYIQYYYAETSNVSVEYTKVLVVYDALGAKLFEHRTLGANPPAMFNKLENVELSWGSPPVTSRKKILFRPDAFGDIIEFVQRDNQTVLQKNTTDGALIWEVDFSDPNSGIQATPVAGTISTADDTLVITRTNSSPNSPTALVRYDANGKVTLAIPLQFHKMPRYDAYGFNYDSFNLKIYMRHFQLWDASYSVQQDTNGRILVNRTVASSTMSSCIFYCIDTGWSETIILNSLGTEVLSFNTSHPNAFRAYFSSESIATKPVAGAIYRGGITLEKYEFEGY